MVNGLNGEIGVTATFHGISRELATDFAKPQNAVVPIVLLHQEAALRQRNAGKVCETFTFYLRFCKVFIFTTLWFL